MSSLYIYLHLSRYTYVLYFMCLFSEMLWVKKRRNLKGGGVISLLQ